MQCLIMTLLGLECLAGGYHTSRSVENWLGQCSWTCCRSLTVEGLIDGALHHFGACYWWWWITDDENDTKQATKNPV